MSELRGQSMRKTLAAVGALAFMIALVYLPGLSGSFQFDDHPNLDILDNYGPLNSLQVLVLYLNEHVASAIGRPVAVLTFLAQADSWPASPRDFLAVNIGLQVVNALLLFVLVHSLLRRAASPEHSGNALAIATLASFMWAAHPFFVSTTLYVVQRMTLLAALFVLAGLLTYVRFRTRQVKGLETSTARAMGYAAAVVLFGGLATFSKENGILLFPLILLVEYLLIRPAWQPQAGTAPRRWLLMFVWLPTLCVATVFLAWYFVPGIVAALGSSDSSAFDKVLLQPLILLYFGFCLLIPRSFYPGLFYDGHPLTDISTLMPWGLGAICLLGLGLFLLLRYRARAPLLTFAISFFLVAISVEALHPGLEPLFEHRAYLPSLFLFLPIAAAILKLRNRVAKTVIVACAVLWLSATTASHSALWGDPYARSLKVVEEAKYSLRAKLDAFYRAIERKDFYQAARMVELAKAGFPAHPHAILVEYELAQQAPFLVQNRASLADRFMHAKVTEDAHEVARKLTQPRTEAPYALSLAKVTAILSAWLDSMESEEGRLEYLLRTHRFSAALRVPRPTLICEDLLYIVPRVKDVQHLMGAAAQLATNGLYSDALEVLAAADKMNSQRPLSQKVLQKYYRDEIQRLRKVILKEGEDATQATMCGSFIPAST